MDSTWMPRLSQFIREHREEILAAWQTFARERPGAGSMDVAALRDQAGAMLDASPSRTRGRRFRPIRSAASSRR